MSFLTSAKNMCMEYFENKNVAVDNNSLDRQIESWFNNTDIAEADMLAACIIKYGYYDCKYTIQDIVDATEVYRGYIYQRETSYPHISEIEQSYRDSVFQ